MEYVDCKLTIGDKKDKDKVTYKPQYSKASDGHLVRDPITEVTVRRLNAFVKEQEGDCKNEILGLLGLHLYTILFGHKEISAAFEATFREFDSRYSAEKRRLEDEGREEEPDIRLRLRLVFTEYADEALTKLPWEFTYVPLPSVDSGAFLACGKTGLILTRFVPELDETKKFTPQKEAVRILIVFCQPDGEEWPQLDWQEVKDLQERLEELVRRGRVEQTVLRDPTYNKLVEEIKKVRPHILHFIGHGKERKLALLMDPSDPDYDDVRKGKQVKMAGPEDIKGLFSQHKPRLIFLSACRGAVASLESFHSTALDLVYQQVPAVVAMQYDIANQDARLFASKFYEELGEGKDIDEAVKEGRIALGEEYGWNHRRFGTPVVYLQTEKAVVLMRKPKQIRCLKCHTILNPNEKFCHECGDKISKPTPEPTEAMAGVSSGFEKQ